MAPGPAISGIPIGTIEGSRVMTTSLRPAGSSSPWSVDRPMIVKRMPPAIWNAGSVMPKTEKIAPPVSREDA